MSKRDPSTVVSGLTPPSRAAGVTLHALQAARLAQPAWAATPVRARLRILRTFRSLAAEQSQRLARLSVESRGRPVVEALTAEVAPLLAACRFLEREAVRLLAPRRLGTRGRPAWLFGVRAEIRREPLGVVLIIGPANYPLFLPAVQALQALAAGNAVLLKPGAGGRAVMQAVAGLLHHAGLDHRLITVLPETSLAGATAIEAGVDKVVLTGSAETGRLVLSQLATHLTPSVMELSGCDAVFVRADANLDLAVRALRFGTLLNNGATCIAPRRVFAHRSIATELEGRLAQAFADQAADQPTVALRPEWAAVIREALSNGAHLVAGELLANDRFRPPMILAGASPEMALLQRDVFAPVLSLVTVADDHEAIELSRHCPYALGATVFGREERAARAFAGRVHAGVVVINDMIVPTADPRLPFSARGKSGFGATRGAEGLLEMTTLKAIALRRPSWMPHFEPTQEGDERLFEHYLVAANSAGMRERFGAGLSLIREIVTRRLSQGKREATTPGVEQTQTSKGNRL